MQKVSRSIFAGLLVIAGLTACGDKVTVPNQTQSSTSAPQVHSVTVTPASVSLSVGQTVQLVASVDADATLARTVTWATTAASLATVSSGGLVTAVASGTVAITATSTADPTVVGAATIIIAPIQLATISIATINNAANLPANLNAVVGQLNVTLNVDQGTQTVTALNLIVHNNTSNTDTTVATYNFTSPQKVPAGAGANASSAPITMSFNTAQFNATSGVVAFLNGSYNIRAQAVVSGSSQTPVTSTINYTLTNADFMNVSVKGDTTTSGPNLGPPTGTLWQAGKVNVTVVPVLYSGVTLSSLTVGADPAFTHTAAQTVTTYPTTVSFAVGKDTLTKWFYLASVGAIYTGGTPFTGVATVPAITVDNEAPALPTTNVVKGGTSQWLPASYAFGNSTDYVTPAGALADPGNPSTPGVGLGAAQFWVWPKASFTALAGGVGEVAACKTTGGTMVTTASALAQSAPNDSTTYRMRALQFDKLGNVVCMDLVKNFGVDNTPPVNVAYLAATNGTNQGALPAANFMLHGTNKAYASAAFQAFTPTGTDSISGFDITIPSSVVQTITVNDVTVPATVCAVGNPGNGCTLKSAINAAFPATGGLADLGYYTVNAVVADRAGNSVALPTTILAVDNVPPAPSGGVAIPAALVGGTPVSLSGTLTDNMTLMNGGGSVAYNAPNGGGAITLNYDANATIASAGTFGTLNKSATVTMNVPWLISDLQYVNNANAGVQGTPLTFNIRGVDEVGLSGVNAVTIPSTNITTGAGTGAGANGEWTAAAYTAWAATASAVVVNLSGTPTSTNLSATVTMPASVPLPFSQVCFFYGDLAAATTAPAPTFVTEYKLIGCVSAAATSDNTNWVYSYGAWTPPAAISTYAAPITNTTNVVAIGYGVNGHAAIAVPTAVITVNP